MNRSEYLKKLEEGIKKMSETDKVEAIRYYEEYFDEAGPENEEKVINELEDPSIIAKRLMAEYACTQIEIIEESKAENNSDNNTNKTNRAGSTEPIRKTVKTNMNYTWMIILGLCATPIAIPLVITLLSVIFSFLIVIFTVVFVFLLLAVIFTVCGVVVFAVSIAGLFIDAAAGIAGIGAGLILIGLGLLTGILFMAVVSKVVPVMVRGIGKLFRKVTGGLK